MGPPDAEPPFPEWEGNFTVAEGDELVPYSNFQHANWLQVQDNAADNYHTMALHAKRQVTGENYQGTTFDEVGSATMEVPPDMQFVPTARLQSFALAAHELHLTPSAISHQVRELEEVFGRALFLRAHRRVELTAEGRRLLEGLTRVLDALEASCAEVNLAASGQVLSVYCAPSLAVKWLGPRLPTFAKKHPDISIRLSSAQNRWTSPWPVKSMLRSRTAMRCSAPGSR
jgi:hypothetical protein